MKIKSAEFEVSAPNLRGCPEWALPEFAMIGRSNVGKSSLINLLTERRDLAKVSDTPGKTKLINFFVINRAWALVDLPGYGYAEVGKQRRLEFNEAVADFIGQRRQLQLVLVLIDSRLPPQRIDLDFLRWIGGCRVSYALVFTKADKQSATKTQENVNVFLRAVAEWQEVPPEFVVSSAKSGTGRAAVLALIAAVLAKNNRSGA